MASLHQDHAMNEEDRGSSQRTDVSLSSLPSEKSSREDSPPALSPDNEMVVSRAGKAAIAPLPAYLERGDVFRTLGLPENFIVGLDTMAMTTSKSLQGFRDIPLGAHFLWVQQPSGVSRCGYWFVTTRQGTARIKQWDRYNEVLGKPGSPPGARNQEDNIEAVYPALQPYTLYTPKDNTAKSLAGTHPAWARSPASLWQALTSAISTESLARITGEQDVQEYLVDSMDCAKDARHSASHASTTKFNAEPINNKLTFLFSQDMRDLQVLDLQPSSSRHADTSARVLALLTTTADHTILADLQFTFLTGTHLGNPACLEQWWNLVLKIVLRAYTLALARPQLARDLLRTLHAQLFYNEHYVGSSHQQQHQPQHQVISEDDDVGRGGGGEVGLSSETPILEYKPLNAERLRRGLGEYRRRLDEVVGLKQKRAPEQEEVGRVFEELETWLWERGWDLRGEGKSAGAGGVGEGEVDSEEEEDEQPVVVELDEEGREVGLVSFRD